MRFDNEELFKELARSYGINLYLGAGFSVYAYNDNDEKLPLGDEINKRLIKMFSLDNSRNLNLSRTCQKIKINNSDILEKKLKEIYTVKTFDEDYFEITKLPIKNIVTINIDNLLEKIYESPKSAINISDTAIYGSLEKEKVVSLYKLHGSVTYPVGSRMSFTETELTDLFIKDNKLFETVSFKLSTAPTIFWGTRLYDSNTMQLICNSEAYSKCSMQKWLVVYPDEENKAVIEDYCGISNEMLPYSRKAFESYIEGNEYREITSSEIWYQARTDFSREAVGTERISHKEERGFELLQGKDYFEGRLLGGCLESFYDILTTTRYEDEKVVCEKYGLFPEIEEWREKVLFIETCEEKPVPEQFEKEIAILKERGIFDVISGVLVGKPQDEAYYDEYKTILVKVVNKPDLPIVYNVNFGHAAPRCVLQYGAMARVDMKKKKLLINGQSEFMVE